MISMRKSGLNLIDRLRGRICVIKIRLIGYAQKTRYRHFGELTYIDTPSCKIVNRNHIAIGNYTIVGKFARIEPVLNYGNKAFDPLIEIGNNVWINQNFHCTCAGHVKIGDGTSITANCGVFDINHPYEDININPTKANILVAPVEIGQDCLIGMNSVIMPGTTLGRHCIVGANSVVKGNFPDYSVLAGSPAKIIKKYDPSCGKWMKTNPDGSFIR